MTDPKAASFDNKTSAFKSNWKGDSLNKFEKENLQRNEYIELQYHCPLLPEMVESIAVDLNLGDRIFTSQRTYLKYWL